MFRSFCIALVLTLGASAASAAAPQPTKDDKPVVVSSGFVNVEATADDNDLVPTINAAWSKEVYDDWGVGACFLMTQGWGEAYFGPTWSPVEGLSLSLSAGVQRIDGGDFKPRFATSVFGAYEKFSFLGIFEWDLNGADGLWYKAIASFQLANWLKLGVEGRRHKGIGPHASVSLWDTKLSLWASWVPIDPEGDSDIARTMFGLKYGF